MTPPTEQRSWSADLPGLDRPGAEKLVAFAREQGISALASAVDPADFFTTHLDRDTVKSLLHLISPETSYVEERGVDLDGLGEDLKDWLDQTLEGSPDDAGKPSTSSRRQSGTSPPSGTDCPSPATPKYGKVDPPGPNGTSLFAHWPQPHFNG